MNLHEALSIALDYEYKVRDHYAKGAETIENPQGKKVFEVLAKEEQGHVDFLENCLKKWKEQGKIDFQGPIPIVAPGLDWIEEAKTKLQNSDEKRVATANEIELLKVALELETTTSGFYRDLVKKLSDEDRPLFDKFIEIEEGHVAIVQAELDSVQGLGFWFDVMEFSLESG